MMRSLFSGVAGLRNHQTKMDVIGNNIANVNTVGFKKSTVNFQEMLVQTIKGAAAPQGGRGGVNAQQIGLGVQVASVGSVQTQGNLQSTGKTTDLAIQGDGYFVLSDGADQLYTRTGSLDLDQDGNLIFSSNGMKVMGWTTIDSYGKVQTNTSLNSITIPIGQSMKPQATESVTYANNLDASAKVGTIHQTQVAVYDSVGNEHTLVVNFEKESVDEDGNTTWGYTYNLLTTDPLIQSFVTQYETYDSLLPGGTGDSEPSPTTPLETQYQVLQLAQRAAFLSNPDVLLEGKKITADLKYADLAFDAMDPAVSIKDQVTLTMQALGSAVGDEAQDFNDMDITQKLYVLDIAYAAVAANKQIAAGNTSMFPESDYSADTAFGFDANYYTGAVPQAVTITIRDNSANTNAAGADTISVNLFSDSSTGFPLTLTETGPNTGIFTATLNLDSATVAGTALGVADGDKISVEYGDKAYTSRYYNAFSVTDATQNQLLESLLTNQKAVGIDELNPRFGKIIFDQSGQLVSDMTRSANYISDPTNINLTRAFSFSPAGARTVSIVSDIKTLTQYVSPFTAGATNQNGNPAGTLQSFQIDDNGTIAGVFSNGFTKDIAVVAIANFNNPGGLLKVGQNVFKRSNNSGLAQIGMAQTGGRGAITPGALEMSNVDLAQEFTDMIVTQRGFQANSRIITTSDEMLQELVNLKR